MGFMKSAMEVSASRVKRMEVWKLCSKLELLDMLEKWIFWFDAVCERLKAKKNFVVVHTGCHGSWSWYKIIELVKSSGHYVTALDLGASGTNIKQAVEIPTFSDYVSSLMKLMASHSADKKVVLVGQSFGGLAISKAMETFLGKISAAVFVSALMPSPTIDAAIVYTEELSLTARTPLSSKSNSMNVDASSGVDLFMSNFTPLASTDETVPDEKEKFLNLSRRNFISMVVNPKDDAVVPKKLDQDGAWRKHHRLWTVSEVRKLIDGVAQYGVERWSHIKKLYFSSSGHRTPVDLKMTAAMPLRPSLSDHPMKYK
ncbi:Polyneuridine-aldehyde esterase [Capsicum annuum]|nr:Polyneuridine-aldehyde esterase [Capsicum annuum]